MDRWNLSPKHAPNSPVPRGRSDDHPPGRHPSALRLPAGVHRCVIREDIGSVTTRRGVGVIESVHIEDAKPFAQADKVITPPRIAFAVVVIAAIALGFLFRPAFDASSVPAGPSKPIATESSVAIAVLPFANRTNEPDYFTDGISEEILNALVRTNSVRVIARTSSFIFRDEELSVQEIGEALGASHVIEGSVSKVADQVRVNAQLVEASAGVPVWSERFDRDLDDIFALQDAIANAIVR